MAKGQKRSNKEVRKPKQAKSKPESSPRSFLEDARGSKPAPAGSKRSP